MACRESLSESLVGVWCLHGFGVTLVSHVGWVLIPPSEASCRTVCRTDVGRFGDQWRFWTRADHGEQAIGMLNGPVGLVGVLSDALSDCLVTAFWWQEVFLKDVSYESLVGELFLEESLVGSCRTRFLARVFLNEK